MKNEEYRRAFDNLNVPADMAERIRCAAAEEEAKAGEKAPAVLPFSGRKIRRTRRAAAVCAVAAALGVLIWRAGLFPLRADRASGGACAPSAQNEKAGSGSPSAESGDPVPGGAGQGETSGNADKVKNGTASEKTAGTAAGTTAGTASGTTAGTASGTTDGTASGTTAGTASEKTAGTASGTTDGTASGTTDGTTAGEPPVMAAGGGGSGNPSNAGSPENGGASSASNPNAETETNLQINNSMRAVSTPADLEGKLDFTPVLPAAVPAGWQALSCAAIGGTLAQIVYTDGSGGEVCWRTAQGTADVSGDNTDYPETNFRGGVTYRGADGSVSTAGWTAGGAAFSLTFSPAVTADAAAAWVAAVRG